MLVCHQGWSLMFRALVGVALLPLLVMGDAGGAGGYSVKHQDVVARVNMMARGAYTSAEWQEVSSMLDTLLAETRAAGDWDGVVATGIIRAKVLDARGDPNAALAQLHALLATYRERPLPAMRRVYVEIAAIHAREGNEDAVQQVMAQFKQSIHYDGQAYGFKGSGRPDDPLVVPRPSVAVSDSVSMTAMEVQRIRSRFAPGNVFPGFNVTAWTGERIDEFRMAGRVVLVDFWNERWSAWNRDLDFRKGMYGRHRPAGLFMVGLYLGRDAASGRAFARQQDIPWLLADAPRALIHDLGLHGNVSNFLIDRAGVIVARDLYGADLEAAIRQALERKP